MQIDIDFEVFKALTALRQSEADSYNAVIRRLLKLDPQTVKNALDASSLAEGIARFSEPNALARFASLAAATSPLNSNALLHALGGAWFGNTHFPDGTQFRATYKGQTYYAEIREGRWIGADGVVRNSPSDAAGAISGTNVNGWRFWFVKRPGDPAWTRMDEFKQ